MKTVKGNKVSRRAFLQNLSLSMGAIGTGMIFPGFQAKKKFRRRTSSPKQVLVIGAGLAGLAAAWELDKAGHQVWVVEARERPGGRVSTIREPFHEGLYAEEGAVAFSSTYSQAIEYIEELGLERLAWSLPEGSVSYYFDGKEVEVTAGKVPQWPFELTEEEKKLDPFGLVQKYILEPLPPEKSNPEAWNKEPLLGLDDISLYDYMKMQGASEGAIALVEQTQWFASDPKKTSGLAMAVSDIGLFTSGIPFLLKGGNDSLPRAMAEKLGNRIRYGLQVEKIVDKGEKPYVLVSGAGVKDQKLQADHIICTIPAAVLKTIAIEPAFPAEKQKAIEKLPVLNITRTFLETDKAFWLKEGRSGLAYPGLPLQQIAPVVMPNNPEENPALLDIYMVGKEARKLGKKRTAAIETHMLDAVEQVLPEIKKHHRTTYVKAWSEDPFALGGPSAPGPGDVKKYLKHLQAPHGRIHFAGEYTTILRSTMEGGLRSGVQAARQLEHVPLSKREG